MDKIKSTMPLTSTDLESNIVVLDIMNKLDQPFVSLLMSYFLTIQNWLMSDRTIINLDRQHRCKKEGLTNKNLTIDQIWYFFVPSAS